jgi:hypothetical protein
MASGKGNRYDALRLEVTDGNLQGAGYLSLAMAIGQACGWARPFEIFHDRALYDLKCIK